MTFRSVCEAQVRGADHLPGRRPDGRGQRVGEVGAGQQRDREHHEQHDRPVIAEKVLARLDPSCAYGLPVSRAAVATTKLASDSRNPPPRMSP
ncbi:MAG TPA: hypothetical protein VHT26_03315, partial [Trebonia sp.]|nr:hypothetical protein [Trebonia sp.]